MVWASSDTAIVTVDEKGTVTAVAPGTAVISATLSNGQKAECTVNCTWTAEGGGETPAGGEEPAAEPAPPAEPSLSSKDITLSSVGASQQLSVKDTTETVVWTTSDEKVATVTADGTVTAVAPGRATVTATVGEKTFNCAIRCIW